MGGAFKLGGIPRVTSLTKRDDHPTDPFAPSKVEAFNKPLGLPNLGLHHVRLRLSWSRYPFCLTILGGGVHIRFADTVLHSHLATRVAQQGSYYFVVEEIQLKIDQNGERSEL